MPIKNTVICNMCGGKFFPSSLTFHQKACSKKQATLEIPCAYCDQLFRRDDMEHHLRKNCPERRSVMLKNKKVEHSMSPSNSDGQLRQGFGGSCGGGSGGGQIKVAAGSGAKAVSAMMAPRKQAQQQALQAYESGMGTAAPDAEGRVGCACCGRKFSADRLGTHQRICRKIKGKEDKRVVHDSSASRLETIRDQMGVSTLPPTRRMGSTKSKKDNRWGGGGDAKKIAEEAETGKKADWRQKSNDFRNAMKQNRMVKRHLDAGGDARDIPVNNTPSSEESSFVLCANCGRSFNEKAHARHAPLCKSIVNKAKAPSSFNRFRGGGGR